MKSLYNKIVAYTTLIIFMITSNVALMNATYAAGFYSMGGVAQQYSAISWTTIASIVTNVTTQQVISANFSEEGLKNALIAGGNGAASALNLTADQVANVINMFPANTPLVVGRFAEGINKGVIDMYKVEKFGTTVRLLHAYFTPEAGEFWAAARTYADPSTKSIGTAGPNPFDKYRGGDHKFYNMPFSGMVVAMGHAMRLTGTPFGLIAQETYRMEKVGPKCKKSAGGLRKKCKVWVYGKAKPTWYFATPPQFQEKAGTAAICAINATTCPKHAIAPAIVAFEKKTGGNLQEHEETVYTWMKSYSGWTVLAFVFAVFVLSAAIAAIGGLQGVGFLSNMINGSGVTAGGTLIPGLGLGGGALAIGAVEAAGYALGAAIFQGGGLGDIQDGLYGKVNNGISVPTNPSSTQERGTRAALENKGLNRPLLSGLSAVSGTARLAVPEAQDYAEHNSVSFYTDNGSPFKGTIGGAGQ